MTTLRLFAQARELAGSGSFEVEPGTVESVLDAAGSRFGSDFAAILERSKVWLNGAPAEPDDVVGNNDEVAVLPPVSGG